jgi:hypothetical protein
VLMCLEQNVSVSREQSINMCLRQNVSVSRAKCECV